MELLVSDASQHLELLVDLVAQLGKDPLTILTLLKLYEFFDRHRFDATASQLDDRIELLLLRVFALDAFHRSVIPDDVQEPRRLGGIEDAS
jgi:hypothetical protein